MSSDNRSVPGVKNSENVRLFNRYRPICFTVTWSTGGTTD